MAAFAGLPGMVTQLIETGSPVNAQDKVGDTPLHDAALQGHVEAARVLIVAGASMPKTIGVKLPLTLPSTTITSAWLRFSKQPVASGASNGRSRHADGKDTPRR